ncbi:MAG: hypothetical protein WAU65_01150 [Candidatus Nanoarchaeia archaeon]
MNKRGFLLGEETVKIIIAVIAILFLVLFIIYLYTNYSRDPNLAYAQDSLNYLVGQISVGANQAVIYNPASPWFLASFPQLANLGLTSSAQDIIPKKCSSVGWTNCLCICKLSVVTSNSPSSTAQLCDNYGVCLQSNYSINGQTYVTTNSAFGSSTGQSRSLLINPPLVLSINYQTKAIQANGP